MKSFFAGLAGKTKASAGSTAKAATSAPMSIGVEVKEDGKGCVLLSVVPPPKPAAPPKLDIVIVMDVSGSMGEAANPSGAEEVKLFSKMDLAKRGAEVVVRALHPEDTFTLIAFSSNVRQVLPRTAMNSTGLSKALEALDSLSPGGGTALWDGLHAGLHQLETGCDDADASAPSDRTRVCIFLTDGQPSPSPPAGGVAELQKYIGSRDAKGKSGCKLVTMGFGYDVNSKLLVDLANTHAPFGNDFAFIPDGTMLLTNFVNLMSNLQSTAARRAVLRITPNPNPTAPPADVAQALDAGFAGAATGASGAAGGNDIPALVTVLGESVWTPVALPGGARGLELQLGDVLFGQPRQVVLRAADPSGRLPNFRAWDLDLLYEPAAEGFGSVDAATDALAAASLSGAGAASVDVAGVTQQLHRALAVSAITQAARIAQVDLEGAQKTIKQAALATIDAQSAVPGFTTPHPILEDLLGEVGSAVGSTDAWNKWGSHYLRSLVSAHKAQACNNFKDPGVLAYGSEYSRKRRDALNDMCDGLPVPKPSILPYGTAYGMPAASNVVVSAAAWRGAFNNAHGGCFAAGTRVLLADGVTTKPVEQLRKGDALYVPSGSAAGSASTARVACVVTYGGVQTVRLPGSGLGITPWHPVRVNGAWAFPADLVADAASNAGLGAPTPALLAAYTSTPAAVYNLVLESGHVVVVDGVEACTLGHGLQEDVVAHPYFGTDAVLKDLVTLPGWSEGWVQLGGSGFSTGAIRLDPQTGLVSSILGAAAPALAAAGAC